MDQKDLQASGYMKEPFVSAPFVSQYRAPVYHVQQLRTLIFAKEQNRRLLWVTAHDAPTKGNWKGGGANLEERKERWLEFHERKTSGIPGLLPLVLDMPVRFTESPDKTAKAWACSRIREVAARVGVARGREYQAR